MKAFWGLGAIALAAAGVGCLYLSGWQFILQALFRGEHIIAIAWNGMTVGWPLAAVACFAGSVFLGLRTGGPRRG